MMEQVLPTRFESVSVYSAIKEFGPSIMKSPLLLAQSLTPLALGFSMLMGAAAQGVVLTNAPVAVGLVNGWLRAEEGWFQSWDLGGQFRTRFEHRSHFGIAGVPGSTDLRSNGPDTANGYTLLRTKMHVGYAPVQWMQFYVEGRDSVAIEDDRRPSPDADRTDFHQAYAALGRGHDLPLSVKIGRQELSFGDERLVGPLDWTNEGRVFDALRAAYEAPRLTLDVFSARVVIPDDHNFNVANDYDWFSGVYASSKEFLPAQESQLFFLARNTGTGSATALGAALPPVLNGSSPRDVYTLGGRFKSLPGKWGAWDYTVEAAGQFGRFKDSVAGPSLDHLAFAVSASGGYTFKECPATPRLGLEYDFGSGDDDPTDHDHGTFENLFPTNHKFYGYIDLVSWQNIHDLRMIVSLKPMKTLSVAVDVHGFWLPSTHDSFYQVSGARRGGLLPTAGTGYGINAENDNWAGAELDVIANWALQRWGTLQLGYGHFVAGDYVKQSFQALGTAADADWVYLQATLNF
jgi:hypothetical protein